MLLLSIYYYIFMGWKFLFCQLQIWPAKIVVQKKIESR